MLEHKPSSSARHHSPKTRRHQSLRSLVYSRASVNNHWGTKKQQRSKFPSSRASLQCRAQATVQHPSPPHSRSDLAPAAWHAAVPPKRLARGRAALLHLPSAHLALRRPSRRVAYGTGAAPFWTGNECCRCCCCSGPCRWLPRRIRLPAPSRFHSAGIPPCLACVRWGHRCQALNLLGEGTWLTYRRGQSVSSPTQSPKGRLDGCAGHTEHHSALPGQREGAGSPEPKTQDPLPITETQRTVFALPAGKPPAEVLPVPREHAVPSAGTRCQRQVTSPAPGAHLSQPLWGGCEHRARPRRMQVLFFSLLGINIF